MSEKEYFNGFDESKYEEEAQERWGGTQQYKESQQKWSSYSEDQKVEIKQEGGRITLRMVTEDPDASPESTMLIYIFENVLGCWDKEKARLLPSLTESLISAIIFLSGGFVIWAMRDSKHLTRGTPAPSRIESCRVIADISPGLTLLRRIERDIGLEGRFLGVDNASFTSTGKIPELLSFCRATTALSASRMPLRLFPELLRPVYS